MPLPPDGLTVLYRRHLAACEFRARGAAWIRCQCPIWCDGTLEGKRFRRSLRTRSWLEAETRLAALQRLPADRVQGLTAPAPAEAVAAYLSHLELDLRRSPITVLGYRCQLRPFLEFIGDLPLHAIHTELLRTFLRQRKGKTGQPIRIPTLRKEVTVLRALFSYSQKRGWVSENPTKALARPATPRFVTQPFDRGEIGRILGFVGGMGGVRGRQARALVLILLYTGLRISDVAALPRSSYDPVSGYLTLPFTQKTGAPVRLKLHPDAVQALEALPRRRGDLWFDLGLALPSAIRKLARRLEYVAFKTGVAVHAHRFRDTFAVELLTRGADIRTVQHLLGHDSVQTTERHYAHFVSEHQALLDRATAGLEFGQHAARPFLMDAK